MGIYLRKSCSNIVLSAEIYEIGYYVALDQNRDLVGKIVFSGTLNDLFAKFIPISDCRADVAMCRIIRVDQIFDLEVEDWFGKIGSFSANYSINVVKSLPVLARLGRHIGFIDISGTCDCIKAVFTPLIPLTDDQLNMIRVQSKPSVRVRKSKFVLLCIKGILFKNFYKNCFV